jgi:Na+/proline symporter
MDTVMAGIQTLRGDEAREFFNVLPPTARLTGVTILAFIVQGLFFAASPTGGEGFTAQRFMAAKNEFHAQVGQLANAALTLIVRVLPFIVTGMIGAAIFAPGSVPDPSEIWARLVHQFSPAGLTGVLVAGIFAAYMSTISTEMNWGASYLVNDVYKRIVKKDGTDAHYVRAAKISSILIFILSLLVTYYLVKGMEAWFLFINSVIFAFILPLSWLRFFWWRLNIYGEAAALVIGLPLGYIVWFPMGFSALPFWQGFLLLFGMGWAVITAVTLMTRPESLDTLKEFYRLCRPPGFWGPVTQEFSSDERRTIRRETISDIIDCFLGIVFCAGAILSSISLFGRKYMVFVIAVTAFLFCGGLFIFRWKKKGIFGGL